MRLYTYNGIVGTIPEICIHFNIDVFKINSRMKRNMSFEQAMFPEKPSKINAKYTFNGITGTIPEICNRLRVRYYNISSEMQRGLSFEEAMLKNGIVSIKSKSLKEG